MRQRPIAERVDELQQRIEALRQSKAQLEARQAAVERKRQERRRYLLGSFLLEQLSRNALWREQVRRELPLFLKEERDRQLFTELLGGQRGNSEASPANVSVTAEADQVGAVSTGMSVQGALGEAS